MAFIYNHIYSVFRDQAKKKKLLKVLHKKALDRNPDEFHFHMINSQVEVQ